MSDSEVSGFRRDTKTSANSNRRGTVLREDPESFPRCVFFFFFTVSQLLSLFTSLAIGLDFSTML